MGAFFEFNPFAEYIDLRVECPRCGSIQHINIMPPMADLTKDTHSASSNSSAEEEECENCGFVFEISLNNGICGGDGIIENIPKDNLIDYSQSFEDDNYWEDIPESVYTDFLDPHVKEIAITIEKIDNLDEDARQILYRSLYAGIIGAFEAYLSDTLISKIMRNDVYKRRFVENSLQMKSMKFSLSEFYEVQKNLDKTVIGRLQEIIYHNLAVVSKLYEAVLNVKFETYDDLAKSVAIRHDIVHRNGKDKQNNTVVIKKEDVQDLAMKVSDFIKNIESQIYYNENPDECEKINQTLDDIFGNENTDADPQTSEE